MWTIALNVAQSLIGIVAQAYTANQEQTDTLYARVEEVLKEGLEQCVSARAAIAKERAETQRVFDEKRKELEELEDVGKTEDPTKP